MDTELKETIACALRSFREGYNNEDQIVAAIEALIHSKLAEAFKKLSAKIERESRRS